MLLYQDWAIFDLQMIVRCWSVGAKFFSQQNNILPSSGTEQKIARSPTCALIH